jgi:hypothetical protein
VNCRFTQELRNLRCQLEPGLCKGKEGLTSQARIVVVAEVDVLERIETVEREVEDLKDSVKTKDTRMKGRLSGASFDEEDFEEAKKSLFEGV